MKKKLMKKVEWCRKLLDKGSWLTKKVNWWKKLIDEESWLAKNEESMIYLLNIHPFVTESLFANCFNYLRDGQLSHSPLISFS